MTGTRTPTLKDLKDLVPLTSADTIPKEDYHRNRIIYVFVDSVDDACTFHGRHITGYRLWKRKISPAPKSEIADKLIGFKLYGLSCPTMGKSKKTSQPYAPEAKKFLQSIILHQMVRVKLLGKDKSGNFVSCQVETSKDTVCFCMCKKPIVEISHELARSGCVRMKGGTVITDAYHNNLRDNIERAKSERIGMWSLDEYYLSPEEFKKKQRVGRSLRKLRSLDNMDTSNSSGSSKSQYGSKGKKSGSKHESEKSSKSKSNKSSKKKTKNHGNSRNGKIV